jgi:hypothetical protein
MRNVVFANGSATANASGGTSPYTYNWSNGGTTQSISNLSAGNYSVTVTDSKGCTATASTTINNTSGPTVDAGADKSGCVGSTFNLSATANGGTSPYTYAWDNGLGNGQNKTVNPGFTTTYTVTVTDANGCTAVDQVKVIIYPNPSVSIDKWHAKCGFANGSATANASGGTSPYTYNWSNGGTTQSISNLSAGNYSVTVTDSKGCTATASTTINNTSGPTVDAGADKSGCVGSTFNLSATANGGTSPYTYAWDNGLGNGQNKTVNPGFTTTYTVTVTDANGCTAVDQVKVIIYPNPSVSIDKWHAKCGFANGSATANASGGTSPYTYNWSNGGTTQSISNLSAGNYSVTVTDSKGCTATASTTINNTNGPTVDAGADKSGCVGSTFNLSATANGGTSPYTYAWDNGLGNGQSKTVNPGFTTTYTVTVTDANGCTAVDQVKVIIYPNPSVSIDKWHAKCGYANGSATANASGGTSPYTYNWSNGGTTQSISNLSAGNYSVTVTDSKGCTATASTSINNTNGPTVDAGADKSGCVGSTFNLSATANGGTSPYTYAWDNGLGNGQNKTVNPGFTTTYTVTVTDANGCTAVDQVKVIIYPNPSVSIDKWHAKCGYANGSATANASGGTSPYTYNWSNGGTTQSISNLSAGNYSVTITDSKGCTATASTTINNTNGPTVDAGADKSGCVGSTFNLSATANGGTSPYTYAWDNGLGNGQNKTVNPGFTTTYTVTVTDANGCTAVDQVKVIIYPNPSVSIDKWHAKCGYANGSATANASGGTSPYTYNWSNGGTTQSISNLSAGNYSVTVTDSKGCIATASTTINNTNGPTVDAGSDKSGCVGSTFNLIATANGGTSPYTYAWDNGLGNGQNKTVNPGFTTTYTVTVTDANGCTAVDQVKVIIYPNPSVSIDKWHAKCGYANGSATANASGGTSPYTYNWSNGGTTQSISNLSAGNYSVTVTDSKGCTATANTTIKQLDGPTVDAGIDQETCKGQLVYLNASANGGTSPYTYAWDNGLGNGQSKTVNPAFTSTYTVTVTDANGCTATDKVKITILDCSPKITHEKTLASITKVGLNTYNVVYHILVKNTGYAGVYDLSDKSGFDDDIAINTVSYSSNAPGNPGNVLFGSGPWKLADNQAIFANTNHLYVISFNVKIDLSATSGGNNTYYSCGRSLVNRPSAGEALFNESLLDLNDDGYYEERDTACGDLPYLEHTKTLSKLVQTGPRNFQVSYNIVVVNKGGKADNYALADRPAFDNDITILGARYNTDAPSHPANPGSINLAGTGPWNLSSGQNINPGAVHTYTIQVDVSINLEDGKGDNRYDQCGRAQFSYPVSNEGLFNESQLDISSDGTVDQKDTACADVPYIVHEKFTQNVIDRGNGDYGVIYKIDVKNLGGASGRYNLVDAPGFDNDFVIQSANYTTNAIGNIGNPNPVNLIGSGPWTLATNQNINAFSSQQYYLTVNAIIDLVVTESQGDEVYSACGSKIQGTPSSGEGLFNQSTLDVNVDGVIDQRDTTCYDIQFNLCSLGDFVWHDKNVNGKQDFGEEGIEGVPVYLYDAITNTVVRTTTTNQYGYYLFDKIQCGKFYVKFVPNGTWTVTTPNAVSDVLDSDVDNSNGPGTTAMTFLSPGEDDRTWDLGLYKCSMMGGRVFFDTDKDGVFDATENGINGLDVFLMDATSGVSIAKTRTTTNPSTPSDDGFYMFNCIKPGTYYVLFERLDQLASSVAYQGGSYDKDSDISHENGLNTTKKISVQSGDKILNIGAGFMIKATVGDYAWIDANANGIQDGGEKPAAGMKVYAYSTSGTMVSEAVTESNGHYMLDGIGQGDYYVKFVPLPGYGFTQAHKGPETIDNDVDGANGYGTTRVYRLQSGDAVPNIDAGLTSQALPIEWLTFDAYFNGKGTELNWTTGIELNNDYYSIERKHESEREFATIGQIGADVNTSAAAHEYDYLDNGVSKSGIYYYRVKQVDKDGVYNYSKVVSVKVSVNKNLGVVIYPNPVNELLKVEYWISGDTEVEVTIFDQGGKNVGTNPFGGFRKSGQYVEAINTSNLAPGQYSLQIKTTNGLVNKRFSVSR